MKKKRILLSGVAVTALVATATGCGATQFGAQAESLVVAMSAEPVSLDPSASANGNGSRWWVDLAYQSLITLDQDGQLSPALAESWEFEDDENKVLRVKLREGLEFANGESIDAAAVAASFAYFKEGSGPTVSSFNLIDATAEGDLEVLFESEESNPLLPTLLTPRYMGGAIIAPEGLEDPSQLSNRTFGAGPYQMDSGQTVEGDRYVFIPNENYFDEEQQGFEEIEIQIISNLTSQVQALKTRQIDAMLADSNIVAEAEGEDHISEVSGPGYWNGFYILDREGTETPELADVRVRQALNYALDRDAIARAAYGDYGSAESQPVSPGDASHGYDESLADYYEYDPDKAADLLEEAGYSDGFSMEVPYKSHIAGTTTMVEAAVSQWAEIGVDVSLVPASNTSDWSQMYRSGEYAITQQNSGGRPMLSNLESAFLEHSTLNPFDVDVPEITDAFHELQLIDFEESGPEAAKISRLLVEEAVTIPIVAAEEIVLYNGDKLEGLEFLGEGSDFSFVYDWKPIAD